MHEKWKAAIEAGVLESLEAMFFITADMEEVPAPQSLDKVRYSFRMQLESVDFRSLRIHFPLDCLIQMGEFLTDGIEVEPNALAPDLAGEFLNMACGRIMANLSRSSSEYRLHLIQACTADRASTSKDALCFRFDTDESWFLLEADVDCLQA